MSGIVVLLVAYVPLALFRGWVTALLWQWYVADYSDIPPLTVVQAVGIGILVSMFTGRVPSEEERDRHWVWDLGFGLLYPAIALGFGWAWTFAR